jgi:S-formylglutathione hydrolase FrmB
VPNGALAAALPEARCFTAPGGHVWPVWRELFERMLARARADAR